MADTDTPSDVISREESDEASSAKRPVTISSGVNGASIKRQSDQPFGRFESYDLSGRGAVDNGA